MAPMFPDTRPMPSPITTPIARDWTTHTASTAAGPIEATARDLAARLAERRVADIGADLLPDLAAAAAELGSVSGISWRFSTDDPAVALLRVIAKVAIVAPDAAGPHTTRLVTLLDHLGGAPARSN